MKCPYLSMKEKPKFQETGIVPCRHAAKAWNNIRSVQNQPGLKHHIQKDAVPCSLTTLPPQSE